MEVMVLNEANLKKAEKIKKRGGYAQKYTVNGEKWLYVIHPATTRMSTAASAE